MMESIIFWYTGAVVWAVIAILILLAVIIGVIQVYLITSRCRTLHSIFSCGTEERTAVLVGLRQAQWPPGVTPGQIIDVVNSASRRMMRYYADADIAAHCNELHRLDCGDPCMYLGERCKVVGVSRNRGWKRYQIRDENGCWVTNLCAADIQPINDEESTGK